MTNVWEILNEMQETNVIEDRREYDREMLAKMYSLTEQEADDLYHLVQREFRHKKHTPFSRMPAKILKENMIEAQHQGFDGWTPHEQTIIARFYDDLEVAAAYSGSEDRLIYIELSRADYEKLKILLVDQASELLTQITNNASSFD